jgi:hypothetical protein
LSYAALSDEFLVAVSTISLIILKVLDAIYVSMKDDYLPCPDEAKWRESAMEYERLWN